jgi:hypothetical protein
MSTISGATAAVTIGATRKAGILFAWFTALMIGTACLYLGTIAFAERVAPAMRVYSYPEGRCTIHFIRPLIPWRHNTMGSTPRYIIVFSFTIHTASNQDYQIVGAGMNSTIVASNDEVQNIINNYHQNSVYPCWYNPSDPSRVVLYRSMPLLSFIWCSSFVALGLLIMSKSLAHIISGTASIMQAVLQVYFASKRISKRKK